MTKKLLKQLINLSFVNNKLEEQTVGRIASLLKRSDLKLYLKGLKKKERSLTVFVNLAIEVKNIKDKFKNIFPDRKIDLNIDPSLLLGLRIIDNDNVFELSLKNSLDKIASYVEE